MSVGGSDGSALRFTHRNSISHHLLKSTEEEGMRKTSGVEESCSEERKESYSSAMFMAELIIR